MESGKRDILKEFVSEVGKNVKKHRIRRKMTMEELGLEVGLDRMNINRIEKGLNITLTTILKLSSALEIKPQELLKTNLSVKPDDLDEMVGKNKASKTKKEKETPIIQINEKYLSDLKKKKFNKDLQEAILELHAAVKRIHKMQKKQIS